MSISHQALLDKDANRDRRTLHSHHFDGNDIDALDKVYTREAVLEATVGGTAGGASFCSLRL